MRAARAAALLSALACAALLAPWLAGTVDRARASTIHTHKSGDGQPLSSGGAPAGPARAPSGPPLLGPGSSAPDVPASEESSASAPPSAGDVLAENGLSSPLCRSPFALPITVQRNCQASGFIAASAPTGDYAFDVNIDTGISKWSNNASATVQDFAQLGWMALVAVTHALIVMFEWCYSLNLLSGAVMSQLTHTLHAAGLTFTEPWMAPALAIASVLAAYHGLVRRRVAETVGQALVMLAMMIAGLWVIANPAGTIGVLERWADEGAMGTLAVMVGGTAEHSQATLAASMTGLFGAVITAPWCYLEFGNVSWCEDRPQLDPGLRKAGLAIAKHLRSPSRCQAGCGAGASAEAVSASLLRSAQTNGQLFLALPANEAERNSTKAQGTLLNVLCGGGEAADKCQGHTATQAEFRSERGTNSRLMGLAPIWLGTLGMLLLFGLLAVRLLIAAAATLLYLLLAPAAVLAPALGDGGRAMFRAWTMRLLAACVSKLTYSFLLGILLAVTHMLLSLTVLGWWAQWCLISAFWWTAFAKRHQALGLLAGERHRQVILRTRSLGRRMIERRYRRSGSTGRHLRVGGDL
jgi:hypothetical protein